MRKIKKPGWIVFLGCLALASIGCSGGGDDSSPAAPSGSLDTTFGDGGRVTTAITSSSSHDDAYGMAIQPDGKIVAVGKTDWGTGNYFALARYNADGTLDSTFGLSGKVVTGFGHGNDAASAVAIQGDGKILAAGRSNNGTNEDFALARYHTNGSLDTSFNLNGRVTTAFGSSHDQANAVAIQPDGKIVAAGGTWSGTNWDFALARYHPDGRPDTTFGTGGKVITAIGPNSDLANAVAIQSDGKIVAAGGSITGGNWDFALVRYHPNGSLDATFGTGGIVTTAIATGSTDSIKSIAIQRDGKIVAAGSLHNGTSWEIALARYHSDGSLDTSFGAGGKVVTDMGSDHDTANALALQSDGKIIIAGFLGSALPITDFAVVRYQADGSLDRTFGTGGKVTTEFGTNPSWAYCIGIQTDGKIVAAGYVHNGSNTDFALARYNP